VVPVVATLAAQSSVPLSVDTSKAVVARQCLERGAHIINDVTAMTGDPDMLAVVRDAGAGAILMHMQGTPATMQIAPHYDDVVEDICTYFARRLHDVTAQGLERERLVLDPGIGFGKTTEHNLTILARLSQFQRFGLPVCLGVSRKGFFGRILGSRPVQQRLAASLAVTCLAAIRGTAQVLRVHDVRETCDALAMIALLEGGGRESGVSGPGSQARTERP
jgi:dihydropteroate synthase